MTREPLYIVCASCGFVAGAIRLYPAPFECPKCGCERGLAYTKLERAQRASTLPTRKIEEQA